MSSRPAWQPSWTVGTVIAAAVGLVLSFCLSWFGFSDLRAPYAFKPDQAAPGSVSDWVACSSGNQHTTDRPNFMVCLRERPGNTGPITSAPLTISTWLLKFQNVGNEVIDTKAVRLTLPNNVHLVPGSVVFYASTAPEGSQVDGEQFAGLSKPDVGLGIGSYAPGGAGYVRFALQPTPATDWACGDNHVTVKAAVDTPAGSKSADVVLDIVRRCP